MANQYQNVKGQILGEDNLGETKRIKTDTDGELQVDIVTIPSLPTGSNTIGTVVTETKVSEIVLVDGTFTTSGNGTANTTVGIYKEALLFLNVSTASGTTPTLDVVLEGSVDGTNWFTLETFTQKTTVATEMKRVTNFGSRLRVKYTIGGTTPSFTFNLSGTFKS